MTLEYNENNQWELLLPVLEDHTEWFHKLMQSFFYAEEISISQISNKPVSFAQWLVQANRDESIQPEIVEKLSAVHSDLFKIADAISLSVQEKKTKPTFEEFEKFITVYEEFISYIRRLEKDLLIDGSGYDSYTGLRSQKMLHIDVERELDRLERRGKSFCIALVRIDHFEELKKTSPQSEISGYIKLVAGLIKLCVRSFDDAYYLGEDEFALCLKQSDVTGGITALERLKNELEHQKLTMQQESDGTKVPLSVSCCIAEPVGGENVNELIKNLRDDLHNTARKTKDAVLEYHEMTPLQRFVQGDND